MYFRTGRGLAENTLSESRPVTLAMRPKPYLSLDDFRINDSAISARLRAMIDNLATLVIQSLNSSGPIEVIRLFGHTDSTGNEKLNVGLGDRRAHAVAAALQDKLKGFLGRVKIVVERSPGETQPTADNQTAEGRARNRRVEVFITTGVVIPPNKTPVVLTTPQLPPESVIRTRPDRFSLTIPPAPRPRSLQDWLDEQLRGPLSPWIRRRIRDAILTGSCALLEVEFGRAGGTLSEKQRQELRDKCRDIAKRQVR
jgi:hypothetical protein